MLHLELELGIGHIRLYGMLMGLRQGREVHGGACGYDVPYLFFTVSAYILRWAFIIY